MAVMSKIPIQNCTNQINLSLSLGKKEETSDFLMFSLVASQDYPRDATNDAAMFSFRRRNFLSRSQNTEKERWKKKKVKKIPTQPFN